MKIKDGRITILVSEDMTRIEVRDNNASITFVRIELTPVQLSQALSRLAYTKCDMEVVGLDLIGKKMENKSFEFKLPKHVDYKDRKPIAKKICKEKCPEGWEPDNSYNSQNSFFTKDGESWARTTIRRWV